MELESRRFRFATERGIAPDYFMHSGLRWRPGSSLVGVFSLRKKKRTNTMKKTLLNIAVAMAAPFAWAQVSETTTTTTTTKGGGTITDYTSGNVVVLKEGSGPRTYHFGKT